MKQLLTLFLLLVTAFQINAQTTRPPGSVVGTVDSVSWHNTTQYKGSQFKLTSGGTVTVERLEKRLVGLDTCIYAVSQSGRYYAMNTVAERHSGGQYAVQQLSIVRPDNELGANLYDAGRSLRAYQGLKLASFGAGLASALTLVVVMQNNSAPQSNAGTGGYLIAGAFSGASLILGLIADGQVHRAGRLLQLASGRITIGR